MDYNNNDINTMKNMTWNQPLVPQYQNSGRGNPFLERVDDVKPNHYNTFDRGKE
jgi:hypothetical protein